MSHRHYINDTKGEFRHVIRASEMVDLKTNIDASPFKKTSFLEKGKKKLLKALLTLVETLTGDALYANNNLRELASIDPKIRTLLFRFIQKGFIKSWTIDVVSQVQSYIVGVTFELNSFPTKTGKELRLIGASGCGTGYTMNQALIPALAELVERQAIAIVDEKKLVFGSEKELKSRNTVPVQNFRYFTKEQRQRHVPLKRNVFDENTRLHWMKSIHLSSGKVKLIPAQMVYGFLSYLKTDEPLFFETNSNGTAAHTNKEEAGVRALLEVLERDAILLYWLKKIAPNRIRKETIKSEEIQQLIRNIEKQSFKLSIHSITTEFGIPTIVSVISGSRNRSFVFMGAACEFDLVTALRKSLFEVARMAQFYNPSTSDEISEAKKKYPFFTTFKERHAWWSLPENNAAINFFLSGKEIDSESIIYPLGSKKKITSSEKYTYITTMLNKYHFDAYLVDITSKETLEVGLYVQKAIVPELVPAYFKEYARPLALKRLAIDDGQYLQHIPHPFL